MILLRSYSKGMSTSSLFLLVFKARGKPIIPAMSMNICFPEHYLLWTTQKTLISFMRCVIQNKQFLGFMKDTNRKMNAKLIFQKIGVNEGSHAFYDSDLVFKEVVVFQEFNCGIWSHSPSYSLDHIW